MGRKSFVVILASTEMTLPETADTSGMPKEATHQSVYHT
jgi:hypothetical protein